MLRGIANISIPNISRFAAHGGRMSFPVDSAALIYSHFEHVSGVAAPEGIAGVAISKLNLLDVLIGRLNQAKTSGAPSGFAVRGRDAGARFDALIESYRNRLMEADAASRAMPYIRAPNTRPGAVLSVLT